MKTFCLYNWYQLLKFTELSLIFQHKLQLEFCKLLQTFKGILSKKNRKHCDAINLKEIKKVKIKAIIFKIDCLIKFIEYIIKDKLIKIAVIQQFGIFQSIKKLVYNIESNIMIKSYCKFLVKGRKSFSIKLNIQAYNFILGRMFRKQVKQPTKQQLQKAKIEAQEYEQQKKRMKKEVQMEYQYDFLQRQKDIELNRDFRKHQQKFKNTIPKDIGKSGFQELVYWSQNAQTPEQIAQLITKFNKCTRPKQVEDPHFYQFVQNVKATVYLAQNYPTMVEYAHFGYKYDINQPQFWLKIEEKVIRKPPKTQEQVSQLIDIVFVMGNVGQGQVIFSTSQKILDNKTFNPQQIAKLIISYFKSSKGQKQWIIQLLVNLQQSLNEASCEVIQSILPVLKQANNIPSSFDNKLQARLLALQKQMPLSLICVASQYFGFEKGQNEVWNMMQKVATQKINLIKKEKGKIPSTVMTEIITGALSSYKFSLQFINTLILPQLKSKDYKILYRLSPSVLSTLSKCLYIYQLQQSCKNIQEVIQGLIMKHFQKIVDVSNQNLINVLKDYTITRLGSRQFYQFLQKIVNDKLQDISVQKYTVQTLTAIYLQSNLCSTQTLQLLKEMAY